MLRSIVRRALVWYIRATGPSPAVLFDTMSDEDNADIPAVIAALTAATATDEPKPADARNAKPRRVVVGWRVRDSDDEHVKNEPGASFGWDWVDDDEVPPAMSRADALDLLRRCRDWARTDGVGDTTFRLVRVTRRAG